MIRLTTMPMPPKVTARPNVLTKASLAARTMQGAYQRDGRRCRSLVVPPSIADRRAVPGEVPERLNGRDWKSRNGGNLVRGFESPPLRHLLDVRTLAGVSHVVPVSPPFARCTNPGRSFARRPGLPAICSMLEIKL